MKRFVQARRPMVTEVVRPLEAFWSLARLFVLFGLSYCLPNQGAGGLVPFPAVSSAPGRAGRHGVDAEWAGGCPRLPSQTVCTLSAETALLIFVAPVNPRTVAQGRHAIL